VSCIFGSATTCLLQWQLQLCLALQVALTSAGMLLSLARLNARLVLCQTTPLVHQHSSTHSGAH
jgi:hypothetical protein